MGKDNSKKSNKSKTIRDAPYSINHFDEDDTDDGDEQTQWSFDSQTHEDNNCTNNSTTPEKRKRISGTTIVSKACEFCRQHHKKCDGNHPCNNCIEKGADCIYTSRKRRGPKKGMQDELKRQLAVLRQQLEEERQQSLEWKTRYMNTLNKPQQQQQHTFVSKPSKEFHLYLTSMLTDYLKIYFTHVHPFHPLLPPNYSAQASKLINLIAGTGTTTSTNSTAAHKGSSPQTALNLDDDDDDNWNNETGSNNNNNNNNGIGYVPTNRSLGIKKATDVDLFIFWALLANSALKLGDKDHASEFIMKARIKAGELFDTLDYGVGCGFGLMAYYYLCLNETDKVKSYTLLVDNLCLQLNRNDSDLYALNLYAKTAIGTYEVQVQSLDLLFNTKLKNIVSATADKILSICLRARIEMDLINVDNNNNNNDSISTDVIDPNMLKSTMKGTKKMSPANQQKLDSLLWQLQRAEEFFNGFGRFPRHVELLIMVQLSSNFSQLFLKIGRVDLALNWATKVLDAINSDSNFRFLCIIVLASALPPVVEAFLDARHLNSAARVLSEMRQLSEVAPLVAPAYQRLNSKYLVLCSRNNSSPPPPQQQRVQPPPQQQQHQAFDYNNIITDILSSFAPSTTTATMLSDNQGSLGSVDTSFDELSKLFTVSQQSQSQQQLQPQQQQAANNNSNKALSSMAILHQSGIVSPDDWVAAAAISATPATMLNNPSNVLFDSMGNFIGANNNNSNSSSNTNAIAISSGHNTPNSNNIPNNIPNIPPMTNFGANTMNNSKLPINAVDDIISILLNQNHQQPFIQPPTLQLQYNSDIMGFLSSEGIPTENQGVIINHNNAPLKPHHHQQQQQQLQQQSPPFIHHHLSPSPFFWPNQQ